MTSQQEQKPKTLIAMLGFGGVYLGTQEIDADSLEPGHVHLPDGCDLPSGKYRWDADRKTFVPLESPAAVALREPHALNAIAAGFLAMWDAGIPLARVTLGWLDFYVRSIDFSDAAGSDPALYELCRRFTHRNQGV